MLIRLNSRHFRFEPPDEDPVGYARWEYREGKRLWERFFASRINATGKEILDLGCGPGGKTCFLASLKPSKVVGVDSSAEMIHLAERARELLAPPEERIKIEFACVDAADLPFPDSYFDLITCSDAFEHFANPQGVLSESARVLRPGGVFAMDFAQWGAWNGHHLSDFIVTPWAHVLWSGSDLTAAVEELARREKMRNPDSRNMELIDDLVKRRINHFQNGLNRLDLATFERFLREERRLKVRWRRRTSAHPLLWPFRFVPGIMELAVARNVYILERI
jgi:SAM-dependent methyltransferase